MDRVGTTAGEHEIRIEIGRDGTGVSSPRTFVGLGSSIGSSGRRLSVRTPSTAWGHGETDRRVGASRRVRR